MKYQCGLKELQDAFSLAAGVVAGKGTRPGPAEVLLEIAKDGTQKVSATDLEVSLRRTWTEEGIEVDEAGAVAIPAAKTLSILRELTAERIALETSNGFVVLSAGRSQFKVVAKAAEEFPPLPDSKGDKLVSLEAALFQRMVRSTAFATATERVHYSLNGAFFVIDKGEVKMVGTDGRRLAVFVRKVKGLQGVSLKGIVPNKGLRLFEKLTAGVEGEVTLSLEKNQLFFRTGETEASTLLIEGTYPDYGRVIPKGNDKTLELSKEDLLGGLKQASILAGEEAKAVRFRMEKDKLTILAQSVGSGEATVELRAIYGDETLELQFNPLFFIDFLRQVEEERVTVKFKDTETAALTKIGTEYTYVVMPLVTH
ncbi:MAG: DNA polymerase III subunit beta [Planctomycetota bacterium]|jgi:DNA polymerase-3 subunit beta